MSLFLRFLVPGATLVSAILPAHVLLDGAPVAAAQRLVQVPLRFAVVARGVVGAFVELTRVKRWFYAGGSKKLELDQEVVAVLAPLAKADEPSVGDVLEGLRASEDKKARKEITGYVIDCYLPIFFPDESQKLRNWRQHSDLHSKVWLACVLALPIGLLFRGLELLAQLDARASVALVLPIVAPAVALVAARVEWSRRLPESVGPALGYLLVPVTIVLGGLCVCERRAWRVLLALAYLLVIWFGAITLRAQYGALNDKTEQLVWRALTEQGSTRRHRLWQALEPTVERKGQVTTTAIAQPAGLSLAK